VSPLPPHQSYATSRLKPMTHAPKFGAENRRRFPARVSYSVVLGLIAELSKGNGLLLHTQ